MLADPRRSARPRVRGLLALSLLALSCLALAGCATVEKGVVEPVHILSDPPGALVTVSYSEDSCRTPCTLDVPRGSDFTVAVEKAGYATDSVTVKAKYDAPDSALSPDITADYLGRVIDSRTHAYFTYAPNPVVFTLKKS